MLMFSSVDNKVSGFYIKFTKFGFKWKWAQFILSLTQFRLKKKDKRQKGERSLHYNACEKGESGQDSLIYLDLDLARV